jgi:nitrogen fixation protein FixH
MILRSEYMWPALVVGLLLFNITASMTILYFAQSDGGPEVIPDYYERSVQFNDQMLANQASAATGWSVELELYDVYGELTALDADGQPLVGLEGTVSFYRPERAQALGMAEVVATGPGEYRFENLAHKGGLWDLALELQGDDNTFINRIRRSVH